MVGQRGDMVVILRFQRELTKEEALNLAAWLVLLADPSRKSFDCVVKEECS